MMIHACARRRLPRLLLLCLAGCVLQPAADAATAPTGVLDEVTVRLKDGSAYSSASITVDPVYLVITITSADGKTRNVSFDMVESILNAQGEDITRRVIADYAAPPPAGDAGEGRSGLPDQRVGFQPQRLPWRVGLSVSPAYAIPFGVWYEGTQADLGAKGVLSIGVSREVAVDLSFQHQPLGIEESYLQLIENQLSGFLGSFVDIRDYEFSVEEFLVAARYLGKARNAPIWGYSSVGMGVFQHRSDISFVVEGQSFRGTDSQNEFAMGWTGGLVYMFSSRVGLDIGTRFDIVFGTLEGMEGVSAGYLFGFGGGLALAF